MKGYIVKNPNTNEYFPALKTGEHATHTELTKEGLPRVFKTVGHAKNAISWWKVGKWHGCLLKGYYEPESYDIDVKRIKERETIPLIIVPIRIVEEKR